MTTREHGPCQDCPVHKFLKTNRLRLWALPELPDSVDCGRHPIPAGTAQIRDKLLAGNELNHSMGLSHTVWTGGDTHNDRTDMSRSIRSVSAYCGPQPVRTRCRFPACRHSRTRPARAAPLSPRAQLTGVRASYWRARLAAIVADKASSRPPRPKSSSRRAGSGSKNVSRAWTLMNSTGSSPPSRPASRWRNLTSRAEARATRPGSASATAPSSARTPSLSTPARPTPE